MSEDAKPDLATLTVQLLSAYVGNNAVPSGELADLIRSTKAALAEESVPAAPVEEEHVPAVSLKASLASRDHILSLIDGKPYKSHLSTRGLSPDDYRARYNLPATYPMVAPGYSEERRKVAKQLGLGRKKSEVAAAPATISSPTKKNGRAKAAAEAKPTVERPRKSLATAKSKGDQAAE